MEYWLVSCKLTSSQNDRKIWGRDSSLRSQRQIPSSSVSTLYVDLYCDTVMLSGKMKTPYPPLRYLNCTSYVKASLCVTMTA
jgi:hypothetical protein